MQQPQAVTKLWWDRALAPDGWFKAGYEAAMQRIEDHTDNDPQNPYYQAPTFNGSGFMTKNGPMLNDEFSELSPADAREIAFEMLALADLAECAPLPVAPVDGQKGRPS